ncbi:hypothetical protein C923_03183 [Plasmodium falciparum UGT5.1]|uniref:Uncharacterized protein n=1 Tax=Plasmodium falciparum UGT5.1 TaxID=1237627 RepID=W7JBA6_PLAFA|nr:hypothetical protein C923_03183 [Plasmodium falciparum UGT5.1]
MDKMDVQIYKYCLNEHLCVYKDRWSEVTRHHRTCMQLVCKSNDVICVMWNHVTPLVISPLRGEPNKTTINIYIYKFRAPNSSHIVLTKYCRSSNDVVEEVVMMSFYIRLKTQHAKLMTKHTQSALQTIKNEVLTSHLPH